MSAPAVPRYTRRPVLDVLTAEGEALVLLADSRVARLSPIGAACYELLAEPATAAELATELEHRFGPPPGTTTRAAVGAVLEELVTAGLLDQLDSAPASAAGRTNSFSLFDCTAE